MRVNRKPHSSANAANTIIQRGACLTALPMWPT